MVSSDQIFAKLSNIEAEIEEIKFLAASTIKPHNTVSLRGMAKLLGSENELDASIQKSKRSLFKEV